jgi:hypothetical protein
MFFLVCLALVSNVFVFLPLLEQFKVKHQDDGPGHQDDGPG